MTNPLPLEAHPDPVDAVGHCCWVNRLSCPPCAGTSMSLACFSLELKWKADIIFPSGDQAGTLKKSGALRTMIGFSSLPSSFATITDDSFLESKTRAKTSRVPSGDNDTGESTPVISLRGVP